MNAGDTRQLHGKKAFATIVLLAGVFIGCAQQPADTDGMSSDIKASGDRPNSPEGLQARDVESPVAGGTVAVVHRAYEYGGYTWIEPEPDSRLIAVDVEFRNVDQKIDLDDVDIIDGKSNDNHGSFPHIEPLKPNGELAASFEEALWPGDPGRLRVLLIYAVPKNLESIRLNHWGQELTTKPVPIVGTGLSLPTPEPIE